MKLLNDFIRNNIESFNTEEPPEGHFERFYAKLKHSDKHRKVLLNNTWGKIAAILVLGLFLSALLFAGYKFYKAINANDGCLNAELCEAEDYYSRQIEYYYKKIEKLPDDLPMHEGILDELREMDMQVKDLKSDLKQNPYDERIIHSIINCYQEKIGLMNLIILRTKISEKQVL
jgi:hypothetical protein